MYASFRYAVRKAAKVRSTWLILIISVALMIGLAGILPFNISFRQYYVTDEQSKRMISIFLSYSTGVATILTMIIAVFAGFKGASLFRDEIEDGSLLIMLSKPITRSTLIFSKWLAYVTVLVMFCFAVSLSHAFGIGIGSNFKVSGLDIVKGIFLEFAFGIIFSLIFAGIALFFSTILNATQTAVTVLVFGVLSPLTSVIQPVTATPEYVTMRDVSSKTSLSAYISYQVNDQKTGLVRYETQQEFFTRIAKDALLTLADSSTNGQTKKAALYDFLALLKEYELIEEAPASVDELTPEFAQTLQRYFSAATGTLSVSASKYIRLYRFIFNGLYVKSADDNAYLPLRIIDFNGHAATLSRYVSDAIFTPEEQSNLAYLTNGRISQQVLRFMPDSTVDAKTFIRAYDSVTTFSPPGADVAVAPTAEQTQTEIKALFDRHGGVAYTLKFGQYIEKSTVLISYVLIAIAVTPVALIILRYKNIR